MLTVLARCLRHPRVLRVLDRPTVFHAARFLLVGPQRPLKRMVREQLAAGPDEAVLDVCCGIGELAGIIDAQYVGVDLNARFVERARRRHRGSSTKAFEVGDVMRLRFPDKHFDKAILINSLHHFPDDEAVRLLAEVRRVTRRLVVVVDADGTPRGIIRRALLAMDRGRYMRKPDELSGLIGRVFPIQERIQFEAGLYTEVLFRCGVEGEE